MLDAHISGPKVGRALENLGHDVKPTERIERVPDDALLEMAAREGRILVTHNARDFLRILEERAPERRHSGLVLIPYSVRLEDFGTIVRGIQRTLGDISQEDWINRVEWMRKSE